MEFGLSFTEFSIQKTARLTRVKNEVIRETGLIMLKWKFFSSRGQLVMTLNSPTNGVVLILRSAGIYLHFPYTSSRHRALAQGQVSFTFQISHVSTNDTLSFRFEIMSLDAHGKGQFINKSLNRM
jgi:hypothetical protein